MERQMSEGQQAAVAFLEGLRNTARAGYAQHGRGAVLVMNDGTDAQMGYITSEQVKSGAPAAYGLVQRYQPELSFILITAMQKEKTISWQVVTL